MQPWPKPVHALSSEQVLQHLQCDGTAGLTDAEADSRRLAVGPNRLVAAPPRPLPLRFLQQFDNPLQLMLLLAGGAKALLGDLGDAAVIISVTVINALIGTLQESKAEEAITALSDTVVTDVEVVRGGQARRLPSAELVPGDLVWLTAGDKVPADLRLVQGRDVACDESALTGESFAVAKSVMAVDEQAPLADRTCLLFAGTFITAGRGCAVVVSTGEATEVGQISSVMRDQVNLSTPLTRKFTRFSRLLLKVIVALAAITFSLGLARGNGIEEMFDAAIALAVGAIPEELPGIVTIILAIGVHRMARSRAIIRQLPAVEALGSTTVICSDKTGTLTQNRMTVRHLYAADTLLPLESLWPAMDAAPLSVAMEELLLAGLLCNDARPSDGDGFIGDPTETALLVAADQVGLDHQEAHQRHPRRDVIPFDSEQQFMATLHGSARILVKGSVEVVLARCSSALNAAGDEESIDRGRIEEAVRTMASSGERVLAFAIGQVPADQEHLDHHHVSGDLSFIGLQGMQDPPRPEAIEAVAACQAAGISVKLITGDHVHTARAIAEQIGLGRLRGDDGSGEGATRAVDGTQLASLSADALAELVKDVDVFARVSPIQKLQLVKALQANGEVVAMTGDGVNDAPALKQADIGIAMGRGGTEVARQAADMLLTDDNFATIKAAVEEGRTVYANLRKTLAFVLPVNGGASMTILLGVVLGMPLPVTALQVLWLNMVCSLAMSVALAFEPPCRDVMRRPPRPPSQPLLTSGLLRRVMVVSLFNWGVIFGLFFVGQHRFGDLAMARTMAVQGLVMVHLVYLLLISHWRVMLRQLVAHPWRSLSQSPAVPLGIIVTVFLQVLFSQNPWLNAALGTHPLTIESLGFCALPMLLMVPVALLSAQLDPDRDSANA